MSLYTVNVFPSQGKIICKSSKSMLARFLHKNVRFLASFARFLQNLQVYLARNASKSFKKLARDLQDLHASCKVHAGAIFLHKKCPFSCKSLANHLHVLQESCTSFSPGISYVFTSCMFFVVYRIV